MSLLLPLLLQPNSMGRQIASVRLHQSWAWGTFGAAAGNSRPHPCGMWWMVFACLIRASEHMWVRTHPPGCYEGITTPVSHRLHAVWRCVRVYDLGRSVRGEVGCSFCVAAGNWGHASKSTCHVSCPGSCSRDHGTHSPPDTHKPTAPDIQAGPFDSFWLLERGWKGCRRLPAPTS